MLFDTAHGASLSIAYPAWLRIMKDRIPERIRKLGRLIFGTNDINDFISHLEGFFASIKSPIRLEEAGITYENRLLILELMEKTNVSGFNYELNSNDYEKLLNLMYNLKN